MPNPSVFPKFPGPLGPSFRSFNLGAPERAIANLEGETNTLKNPNYLTALREKLLAENQLSQQITGNQSGNGISNLTGYYVPSFNQGKPALEAGTVFTPFGSAPLGPGSAIDNKQILERVQKGQFGVDVTGLLPEEITTLRTIFGHNMLALDKAGIRQIQNIFSGGGSSTKLNRASLQPEAESETTELGQKLIGNIITSSGRGIRKSNEVIKRA